MWRGDAVGKLCVREERSLEWESCSSDVDSFGHSDSFCYGAYGGYLPSYILAWLGCIGLIFVSTMALVDAHTVSHHSYLVGWGTVSLLKTIRTLHCELSGGI